MLFLLKCSPATALTENIEKTLSIVDQGRSNFNIVVGIKALSNIRLAAKELQRLIRKSTNVVIPIVNKPVDGYQSIFVGGSKFTREYGIYVNDLKKDHYKIIVRKQNLFLVGNDDDFQDLFTLNLDQTSSAGTFFAVIDFARRFLNANWFMPGEHGEEIAQLSKLTIPQNTNILEGPYFRIRYIDIATLKNAKFEERAIKRKLISRKYFDLPSARMASRWGRYLRLGNNFQLNVGHAWRQWIPAEKSSAFVQKVYGKTNPQFFARPGGNLFGNYYHGRNHNLGGQLCVCNPNVITAFSDNIINYAQNHNKRSFSLSPNDGGKWDCQCECCRENPEKFLANTSELTEQVIIFASAISTRVGKVYPDARFGIYGYSWMKTPPTRKINKAKNLAISDVQNGLPYYYHIAGLKEEISKNMIQWRKTTSDMVLTSYYYHYGNYSLPWSTPDVLKWLIKILAKNPTSAGIRMNYALFDVAPMGLVGPDPWILSELLWNPNQSYSNLQNKYYIGAFGDEAGHQVKLYFKLINESMRRVLNKQTKAKDVRASNIKSFIFDVYSPIRKECRQLLNHAKQVVAKQDIRFLWRLEKIETAWQLVELTLDMLLADKNGKKKEAYNFMKLRRELLISDKRIFSLASATTDHEEGITSLVKQ